MLPRLLRKARQSPTAAACVCGAAVSALLGRGEWAHAQEDCTDCAGSAQQSSGSGEAAQSNRHSTAKWRVYTDRARQLHQQGRVEEARAFFESAVKEAEKGFGPEDEHLAASYQNLAELLRINGEFGGAEELYLKAIKMLELKSQKRASPSSGTESKFEGNNFISEPVRQKALATTVDRLCGLYLQMRPKRLDDARNCYQKALRLKIEAFGNDHIEVANTLASAAQVSRLQGRQRQSIDMLGQSLDCLLRNQGNEDETGRMILNDSLMILFRRRTLQLANLLLKQERGAGTQGAEFVLRRLIKLTLQSQEHDGKSFGEEELLAKDHQLCNLFCQSLVASKDGQRCAEAVKLLRQSVDNIASVSRATGSGLQGDLLECAVRRQLADAYLCVALDSPSEKRKKILEEVQKLNLEKLIGTVEHWWDDLRGKQGLESLKTKRLFVPVTQELLMHLHLAARYEREQGLLDSKRRSELLSQVVRIAEALHVMPAAGCHEARVLAEKVELYLRSKEQLRTEKH